MDTASDPRAPSLAGIVEAKDVAQTGLSWLHSAHCLGSGEIMISTMVWTLRKCPTGWLAYRACLGTLTDDHQQAAEQLCTLPAYD